MDKAEEIKEMQAWLDHRSEVEQEEAELIARCRFEEAMALLETLS